MARMNCRDSGCAGSVSTYTIILDYNKVILLCKSMQQSYRPLCQPSLSLCRQVTLISHVKYNSHENKTHSQFAAYSTAQKVLDKNYVCCCKRYTKSCVKNFARHCFYELAATAVNMLWYHRGQV